MLEVYGWDFRVISSNIIHPLEGREINETHIVLHNSDFSTKIGFARVDKQSKKYKFTGKLVEAVELPPDCGFIAWAIVQKFEILTTNYPNYPKKYVLIIETCPKKNFFFSGQVYEMDVSTNSGVTFEYSYTNKYGNKKFPIFWSEKIKEIK